MDGSSYIAPTALAPQHDLKTREGRLVYLRDVVVPGIPEAELNMATWDCGTHACLIGWAHRRPEMRALAPLVSDPGFVDGKFATGFLPSTMYTWTMRTFDLTARQTDHLVESRSYGTIAPSHAALQAHIDHVIAGRFD
jgi:hypothetical protein